MGNTYTQETSWDYGFEEATLDRRVGRESVVAPMCPAVSGVDGNHEGGLRVFPGFSNVRDLEYQDGADAVFKLTSDATPYSAGSFTLSITAPDHASVTTIQTTASIAFDAIPSAVETALELLTNVASGDVAVTISGGTDLGDVGSIMTFTFANGLGAMALTFAHTPVPTPTGNEPALSNPVFGRGNHDETSVVSDFFPITFLKEDDQFCRGFAYRVQRKWDGAAMGTTSDVFIDFWDSSNQTWNNGNLILSGVDSDEPMTVTVWGRFVYVFIRGESAGGFYFKTSQFVALTPLGPGKRLKMKVEDGIVTESAVPDTASAKYAGEVGHVTTVMHLWNNQLPYDTTGVGTPLFTHDQRTADSVDEAVLMVPGTYSVAVRLLDSVTGRRSALSEIGDITEARFTDTTPGVFNNNYVGVRIVWDTTVYDKAEIYRSVRVEDMGSTMAARIVHSTEIITLEDWAYDSTVTSPVDNSFPDGVYNQALFFFKLDDVATSWQPPYMDNRLFDEEVPKGGTAVVIDNTLFVANVGGDTPRTFQSVDVETDIDRSVSQLRWSSTVELSPELFSPNGYYNFDNPGSEIVALTELAGNALGFSRDRQYHIRREGRYIKVHELHRGYGIAGPHCHQSIGNMCYFLTDKGLKSVGANGQLDDVRSVNRIILEDWKGQLEECTMALDAAQSCLYILNPAAGEAICMWFNTAKVTKLTDLPFDQVRTGYWPESTSKTAKFQLQQRAFWMQNAPKNSDGDIITGWKTRMFIVDHKREKLIVGGGGAGSRRITLGDYNGDSRWNLDSNVTGTQIQLEQAGVAPTAGLEGLWAYVMECSVQSFVGTKVQIHSHDTQYVLTMTAATAATWMNLPALGTRIALSPIPFEIVGWPLDQRAETGEVTGRSPFHVRHIDALGAIYTEVSGYPTADGSTDPQHVGLAYRTEGVLAPLKAYSYDENNDRVRNIREEESVRWVNFGTRADNGALNGINGNVLCPGMLVLCPDLEFTLLSMQLAGKMIDSRTQTEATR